MLRTVEWQERRYLYNNAAAVQEQQGTPGTIVRTTTTTAVYVAYDLFLSLVNLWSALKIYHTQNKYMWGTTKKSDATRTSDNLTTHDNITRCVQFPGFSDFAVPCVRCPDFPGFWYFATTSRNVPNWHLILLRGIYCKTYCRNPLHVLKRSTLVAWSMYYSSLYSDLSAYLNVHPLHG